MENNEKVKKYIEYIYANKNKLCNFINGMFFERKEYMKQEILKEIKKYLNDKLIHYEWYYDDCPYDFSGELKKSGVIDLNQKVYNFLENEYTGNWEATYESYYGKRYVTYGDELGYFTFQLAGKITNDALLLFLTQNICEEISKDELQNVFDEIFSNMYDDLLISNFFFWEMAADFVELENVMLKDIAK